MGKITKDQLEIRNLTTELYFQIILFSVVILVFVSLAATFIIMAIKAYDWKLVTAVGASDSVFALVVLHITKSLFKQK